MQEENYTILAPGFAKWWGSDSRALAQAFRRLGHAVLDIDEEDYVPWHWQSRASKVLRRLLGPVWVNDYNAEVLKQAASSYYDFVLVYKGNMLKVETVRRLRELGKPLFNFYPDVSFKDHGSNIPATLRLYDCVFSTKSYHGRREIQQFGIKELRHVRHGFDPEVHRPIPLPSKMIDHYGCDVSFVGCWSPEKEERLLYLLKRMPSVSLKVYGLGWNYASDEFKRKIGANLRAAVFGDELAIAYCASKVNLGLLSCSKSDPTLRDQTTARTFQIPATGSFLLHENTPEVRTYFEEDKEVMLFNSNGEMVAKIELALKLPAMREDIRRRGFERSQRGPYDYSSAARDMINYFEMKTAHLEPHAEIILEDTQERSWYKSEVLTT